MQEKLETTIAFTRKLQSLVQTSNAKNHIAIEEESVLGQILNGD